MTPSYLAFVPPVAIAAILVAVWLAGGRRSAAVRAPSDALTAARAADETQDPTDAVVAADGSGALVTTRERTAVAAVFAVGDRVTARYLTPDEVERVSWTDTDTNTPVLNIELRDFGCPAISLPFSRGQAREWGPLVERCLVPGGAPR